MKVVYDLFLTTWELLAASRPLLEQLLLACLNLTLDTEDLFFKSGRSDFYELWQQHKQLKTMERGLNSYFQLKMYISVPIWTHSQNQ